MYEIKLYDTLSRSKEIFKPINKGKVGLYSCGPTVYDYDHLGHAWNYFVSDILRRVLEYNNYKVKHVLNITDVGHLVSDADSGEDKMEKSARERGKSAWEIAEYFTKIYLANREKMNFLKPEKICKATNHIPEMIKLVKILLDKNYAYEINDGIYYDTEKFSAYGHLSGNTLDQLKEGARVEVNPEKKNPGDFALWKFSPDNAQRQMEWKAFKRMGFPGWHIECSAMSMKYLGEHFDIHTGGEDNIFPHHESEIAQSESTTGVKFVNYWVHTRFLQVDGKKMSKSLGNYYKIADIEERGFTALDLRYLFLQTHYRQKLNFTWDSLRAAQIALAKLKDLMIEFGKPKADISAYAEDFLKSVNDDLNTPKALGIAWEMIKDKTVAPALKKACLLDFDKVLGLKLNDVKIKKIPKHIQKIADQRDDARKAGDWQTSDQLREQLKMLGYEVEDSKSGAIVKKII